MDDLILTETQEKVLLDTWNKDPLNPPSLKELTMAIFGQDLDGRSKEGRAIKKCLAKHNLRARATSDDFNKSDSIVLSEAHQLYITNNAATNSSLEMAKIIFSNPSLTNLSAETRAVNNFVKSLDTKVIYNSAEVEDIPKGDYEPPQTLDKVLRRVNEYVNFIKDKAELTPQHKKNLQMLIEYMHNKRFLRLMDTFQSEKDRITCEDAFIRYTYDKSDLTQEEVDQYIELCHQIVQGFKIQRRSEKLQSAMEEISGNDPDSMKISMGLVEAIGKASTEYHQCIARQEKLLSNLTEKRSNRLENQVRNNSSILNLVQMWKEQETREQLLKLAEQEQKAIALEVDKFISMPEIKARIMGLTKEEILNG